MGLGLRDRLIRWQARRQPRQPRQPHRPRASSASPLPTSTINHHHHHNTPIPSIMTTRRIISTEKTFLDQDDPPVDETDTAAVSTSVPRYISIIIYLSIYQPSIIGRHKTPPPQTDCPLRADMSSSNCSASQPPWSSCPSAPSFFP